MLLAHSYRQMLRTRHFGMDAEIQRPRKAICMLLQRLIRRICNNQVTVHGTGFLHPCRNDGTTAWRDLCITMSVPRGNAGSATLWFVMQSVEVCIPTQSAGTIIYIKLESWKNVIKYL